MIIGIIYRLWIWCRNKSQYLVRTVVRNYLKGVPYDLLLSKNVEFTGVSRLLKNDIQKVYIFQIWLSPRPKSLDFQGIFSLPGGWPGVDFVFLMVCSKINRFCCNHKINLHLYVVHLQIYCWPLSGLISVCFEDHLHIYLSFVVLCDLLKIS